MAPATRPRSLTRAHWRRSSLVLAALLAAACLLRPALPLTRPVYRYLVVIDITQSMNVADYQQPDLPAERLGYIQAALRRVLPDLPCGSEIGLGLFTNQNTQILFEPLEICTHFAAIDDAVQRLDWRMAWAADSLVARGLYSALEQIAARQPPIRLVFFSDGEEMPPNADPLPDHAHRGSAGGLVVGVGATDPVPIPRYDQNGQPLGYWRVSDLDQSPGRAAAAGDVLLLSRLDETRLATLAAATGLGYHRLTDPVALSRALQRPELAVPRRVDTDARPLLALAALLMYLSSLIGWRQRVSSTLPDGSYP